MTFIKVFIYALILLLSFSGVAEAKGRNGGSAFKGGFSSQRQKAARPVPSYAQPSTPAPSAQPKTSFGSFEKSSTEQKSGAFPPSQMSKDLSAKAAQTNALNAAGFDRRNPNTQQPVIHQTVVHQNGGGFMHGLMWFMLGHSLAQQHNNTVYLPANNQIVQGQGGWDSSNSNQANGMAPTQDQVVEQNGPVVETESVFMKFLRLISWVALIVGAVWVVRKLMKLRNQKFSKNANYSLGS